MQLIFLNIHFKVNKLVYSCGFRIYRRESTLYFLMWSYKNIIPALASATVLENLPYQYRW